MVNTERLWTVAGSFVCSHTLLRRNDPRLCGDRPVSEVSLPVAQSPTGFSTSAAKRSQ